MNLQIDTIRIDDEKLRVLALNTYSAMKSASVNEDKSVRSRPTLANSIYACKNIIWINDITEEIGFAGIDLCRCFKLKDIVKIEIVNILPAKGPGGMEFNVILNPKKFKFESRLVF
jgi:hypothetical protein